ncbi:hypothetical protein ASPFODRAFT_316570 [Aspergillus luchuensis CBS 106.47]|uniref:Uncharacterized protein n=1 Tax=Aspergillus luchuensis (strain CBS 106.47) TaxID=1137211 RepID=A0A1M3T9E2_ASPLC|nr:hypothetical protein ASPFODRAFT_316570 [Aspergillus luchuensis CBS 106.47]
MRVWGTPHIHTSPEPDGALIHTMSRRPIQPVKKKGIYFESCVIWRLLCPIFLFFVPFRSSCLLYDSLRGLYTYYACQLYLLFV